MARPAARYIHAAIGGQHVIQIGRPGAYTGTAWHVFHVPQHLSFAGPNEIILDLVLDDPRRYGHPPETWRVCVTPASTIIYRFREEEPA